MAPTLPLDVINIVVDEIAGLPAGPERHACERQELLGRLACVDQYIAARVEPHLYLSPYLHGAAATRAFAQAVAGREDRSTRVRCIAVVADDDSSASEVLAVLAALPKVAHVALHGFEAEHGLLDLAALARVLPSVQELYLQDVYSLGGEPGTFPDVRRLALDDVGDASFCRAWLSREYFPSLRDLCIGGLRDVDTGLMSAPDLVPLAPLRLLHLDAVDLHRHHPYWDLDYVGQALVRTNLDALADLDDLHSFHPAHLFVTPPAPGRLREPLDGSNGDWGLRFGLDTLVWMVSSSGRRPTVVFLPLRLKGVFAERVALLPFPVNRHEQLQGRYHFFDLHRR
ncbi:hypothetical protein JCM10213_002743 [Rhodosporidiobolus nylandii]